MGFLLARTVAAVLILLSCAATEAHNITKILAKHPEFSTFNHYLTITHLAADINSRETITVCAVDNAGMTGLLSKGLPIHAMKHVLSFHVLLDYFGAKKLHQITNGTALSATMFQATGTAAGSSGFVNITDLKGGKVAFGAEDNGGKADAYFVKSVEEIPYNISVIHISSVLTSPEAEAPSPGPSAVNLTGLMSKHRCKVFAETLSSSPAEKTFEDNLEGGLTVFCPSDEAFTSFLPKYKNLTAGGKQALLEYHGVPVYESMQMLKTNNGPMNTLATDGANKYDFTVQNDGETVTLKTKIVIAKITATAVDEDPVAIYTINKVLMPKELFKNVGLAPTPAPAPAPEAVADAPSPKSSKKKKKKHATPPAADSPDADSPDADSADQAADSNDAFRFDGSRFVAAGLCLVLMFLHL